MTPPALAQRRSYRSGQISCRTRRPGAGTNRRTPAPPSPAGGITIQEGVDGDPFWVDLEDGVQVTFAPGGALPHRRLLADPGPGRHRRYRVADRLLRRRRGLSGIRGAPAAWSTTTPRWAVPQAGPGRQISRSLPLRVRAGQRLLRPRHAGRFRRRCSCATRRCGLNEGGARRRGADGRSRRAGRTPEARHGPPRRLVVLDQALPRRP